MRHDATAMLAAAVLLTAPPTAAAMDSRPVFGEDWAGMDYNVTAWHSGPDRSANHYESVALACQAYCLADPRCCAWTYCPPGSGPGSADGGLGERCCLKDHVPASEAPAAHWTGLAPRAFAPGSGNRTLSRQCATPPTPPPPPPPGPQPYPGPAYLAPKIHNSPSCLHKEGWHDIAGALTVQGTHHVFQGCPADNGWHHAASTDLVHWEDRGLGPMAIRETHAGMDSDDSPCSGFVTVDDEGNVCAGFRQCGSTKGVDGGKAWDVPLELRCAEDANLTNWSEPIYLYDVFFYRALPYDPIRPWKDADGMWWVSPPRRQAGWGRAGG